MRYDCTVKSKWNCNGSGERKKIPLIKDFFLASISSVLIKVVVATVVATCNQNI